MDIVSRKKTDDVLDVRPLTPRMIPRTMVTFHDDDNSTPVEDELSVHVNESEEEEKKQIESSHYSSDDGEKVEIKEEEADVEEYTVTINQMDEASKKLDGVTGDLRQKLVLAHRSLHPVESLASPITIIVSVRPNVASSVVVQSQDRFIDNQKSNPRFQMCI